MKKYLFIILLIIGLSEAKDDSKVYDVIIVGACISWLSESDYFSSKAQNGKLSIEEMKGGTFTISNGGVFGSLLSTPILNAPQTAILGMHKIQDRPVVVDDKIEIRPMMYLALSYDHRLLDGKDAVSFLISIKEQLEKPEGLLLNL